MLSKIFIWKIGYYIRSSCYKNVSYIITSVYIETECFSKLCLQLNKKMQNINGKIVNVIYLQTIQTSKEYQQIIVS